MTDASNRARPDRPPIPRHADELPELTDEERAIHDWQFAIDGLGESAQRRLKAASVLVSRVGGLGGSVALQLAAAGVGRLVLAHAGNLRPSDLNRQTLMSHAAIGRPRLASAIRRLHDLNPRLDIVPVPENASPSNALDLVRQADVVVDAAPLFPERFALNQAAVTLRKPMVESAVFDLDVHLTTLIPGRTPCLRCLYPEDRTDWTRKFPVLGAVSATAGSLAALEVLRLIAGLESPLAGVLLTLDLRTLNMKKFRIRRLPGCPVCRDL